MPLREFLLERYYARYEFTVPLQLSASDCESMTVAELLELGGADLGEVLDLSLGYTRTRGALELREAIASWYPGRGPDDVLVANAPQEAIFLAMHALLKAGDRVVVLTPCYQSLKEVARSIGCEVVEWALVESEEEWSLDLERLESLLEKPTRLLITNAPHNPTGLLPSASEWERMRELVERHAVRWFSDEMYRGLEPDPALALPSAASLSPGAVSLWGTSKSFGLPGLRIGWLVAGDPETLERIEALKDYTTICSSALGERLARVALDAAGTLLEQNRARIAANTALMEEFARRQAQRLHWLRPRAGPVSLVRLNEGSADEHAARMRAEAGVLLVPSSLFDLGDRHLRVGLGRAAVPEALERWERALG